MSKTLSIQPILSRLFQLALALIPAFEGWLALLNDAVGAKTTLTTIMIPLLSMQGVQPEFLHSWRAIHSHDLQILCYITFVSFETLVGVLATIGLVKMLLNFTHDHVQFVQAQAWARMACALGIIVWGFGFFVISGDFFLSWQTSNINYLQVGGLNYALMMFIPYVLLKKFEQSQTI